MWGADALVVDRVTVEPERVAAVVRVQDGAPLRTSEVPGLASAMRALLPGIARHRCESGSSRGILSELDDTELPHLLEHVGLEVMALAGSPRSLSGETEWDFAADGRGVFRVSLGYDDDLVALAALRAATALINTLIEDPGRPVDIAGEVARVAAVRSA